MDNYARQTALLKKFLDGEMPDVPGMELEVKKDESEDEAGMYFSLPLGKEDAFVAVRWGRERRAAALFREEAFDAIVEVLKELADSEDVRQYGRRAARQYMRMLLLSAHYCEYSEALGFPIHPILLDETWKEWRYIENEKGEFLEGFEGPFAFVAAKMENYKGRIMNG